MGYFTRQMQAIGLIKLQSQIFFGFAVIHQTDSPPKKCGNHIANYKDDGQSEFVSCGQFHGKVNNKSSSDAFKLIYL